VLWPLVAKTNNIPVDAVKWVTMDAASMGPSLLAKRVDAAPQALWHEKRLNLQGGQLGVSVKPLPYSENGVDAYSLTFFARTDTIEKNPDLLKRFLRATVRSIEYTWAKPNAREGAQAVVKFNSIVDIDGATGASEVAAALAIDDEIKSGKYAIGQADPARVDRIRDMYVKFLSLKRSPSGDEIFTNALLPATK
jgi:NitT/TauT family transport system substrate-binding protein